MTPKDIDLVQTSFAKVVPIAQTAAQLFYGRLFEIQPQIKPLFKGDLSEQGKKLMGTLGYVVNGLDKLETVLPAARELAVKHLDYGVEASHCEAVGEALLWTLGEGLGDAFDNDTEQAWVAAYGALSGVMIEAAYQSPQAAE